MVSWLADQKEGEFKQLFNAVLNWTFSFMKLINMPGKVLNILMPAQCVSIAEDMNVWKLFCKYDSYSLYQYWVQMKVFVKSVVFFKRSSLIKICNHMVQGKFLVSLTDVCMEIILVGL
jgi:hypothetical protein